MLRSQQTPWLRDWISPDYPTTLGKLAPLQDLLRSTAPGHLQPNRKHLPWKFYRDAWKNSNMLDQAATLIPNPDPAELTLIHQHGSTVRRWAKIALVERAALCIFPRVPALCTEQMICHYQNLCVVCRTYCEAKAPEFIDLFTDLV